MFSFGCSLPAMFLPSSTSSSSSSSSSTPNSRRRWWCASSSNCSIAVVFAGLLLLMTMASHSQALPLDHASARLYYATMLREPNGDSAQLVPIFRFVGDEQGDLLAAVAGQKKRRDLGGAVQPLLAKKYDRNCFFSPVQCMLSFKDGSNSMGGNNDVLQFEAGRRRRR